MKEQQEEQKKKNDWMKDEANDEEEEMSRTIIWMIFWVSGRTMKRRTETCIETISNTTSGSNSVDSTNKGLTKFQMFLRRVEEKTRNDVRKELKKREEKIRRTDLNRKTAAASGERAANTTTDDAIARHLAAAKDEVAAEREAAAKDEVMTKREAATRDESAAKRVAVAKQAAAKFEEAA